MHCKYSILPFLNAYAISKPTYCMFPEDQSLTPEESLRADNEIAKVKLELDGFTVQESGQAMPPEVSRLLLEGIQGPTQRIYELIGQPPYVDVDDIGDDERVEQELARLRQILAQHGIDVIVHLPDEYHSRTIYRFVTDDVLTAEVHLALFTHSELRLSFVYERYYPGREISLRCDDCLDALYRNDIVWLTSCLSGWFYDIPWEEERNFLPAVTEGVSRFKQTLNPKFYYAWTLAEPQLDDMEEKATVDVTIRAGKLASYPAVDQTTSGRLLLELQQKEWVISTIDLPGLHLVQDVRYELPRARMLITSPRAD